MRATLCKLPIGMNIVPICWNKTVGITNWPNFVGLYTKEGHSCYAINSEGWRDRQHDIVKPANVFRIAIIGDSYVEALQIERKNTFWSMLESDLQQKGWNVEMLVFGMSGFDAATAYQALQHHVIKYEPNLVVFMFYPGNDLRDSVREISDISWKPYYTLDSSGNLVLDHSFESFVDSHRFISAYRRIRNSSLVLLYTEQGIRNGLRSLQTYKQEKKAEATNNKAEAVNNKVEATNNNEGYLPEAGLSGSEIYSEPEPDSLYDDAWQVTEKLVLTMKEYSELHEAEFMVVGITNGDRMYKQEITLNFDPFYPEKRMEEFSSQNGIYYLPLAYRFLEIHQEKGIFLHGFGDHLGRGHWNENGHQEAAKAIEEFLIVQQIISLQPE